MECAVSQLEIDTVVQVLDGDYTLDMALTNTCDGTLTFEARGSNCIDSETRIYRIGDYGEPLWFGEAITNCYEENHSTVWIFQAGETQITGQPMNLGLTGGFDYTLVTEVTVRDSMRVETHKFRDIITTVTVD